MIFRAVFWIAVVAILMPREPDLGLGRPNASAASIPGALLSRLTSLVTPNSANASAAAGQLQAVTFRSLAEVKAEIEEAKRERAEKSR